ncbi:MAG: 16S rRNA (guanine(966)-N(2))-methyltransferase RsmD [Clostridia bacterium]|nr:16S rRNA (guanine(966)-N(2))-methyltransferase RsmD [Clostridia bacterium]
MRIITGKFRGRKLVVPKQDNPGIRPTLDRVKEPLFSMLQGYFEDAYVLDLFAGTGNLGLESISRGAKLAILNDCSRESLHLISTNVALTQAGKYAKITGKEYDKCLKNLWKEGYKFNVIFLDPPYATNYEKKALDLIVELDLLDENGVIVLESDKRKEIDEEINGLEMKDKRTYGRVTIRLYKWKE